MKLAAPGLTKENFKLNLERNQLSIWVEQSANHEDNQRNYSKREYSYSSFVRSFTLPESADDSKIDATYTDGILRINIAKREEAKTLRRQIEIISANHFCLIRSAPACRGSLNLRSL